MKLRNTGGEFTVLLLLPTITTVVKMNNTLG